MKIIYVTNSRFPSEKAQSDHVMQMCQAFAQLGHEVTLFVPDRKGVAAQDPFAYYARPQTFTFERLPCLDWTGPGWWGRIGFFLQTISFILALRARIRRIQPDVVYSRELFALVWSYSGARRVWESHAIHRSSLAAWLARRLDLVVTLTQESARQFFDLGLVKERVFVEPDAVDPALFSSMPSRETAREVLGVSSDEALCLYVGKFTTMGMPKGLEESIEAINILRSEGKKIRLLAVGGTPEELQKYAPFAGDGVTFLGHQPQTELKRFYAAGDIALMPFPYTRHYAFFMSPLKLFEYLMSGLPIVASDLPSVREILSEKEAYLPEPGSVPALAQALCYILSHSEEARAKALRSQELALRYTWQARAQRISERLAGLGISGRSSFK